ncbi:hypothetical protein AAVH_38893 [Aphelenchoides avenae]|nr:hypothetical protein AAVH_38893 [Aphelenchus avenae]
MGANESVVNRGTVEWPHYERVVKRDSETERQKRDSETSEDFRSDNIVMKSTGREIQA